MIELICKNKTIHYGNMITNQGVFVLLRFVSGLKISVLWEGKGDPPRQDWWNDRAPEWTTIEEVFK